MKCPSECFHAFLEFLAHADKGHDGRKLVRCLDLIYAKNDVKNLVWTRLILVMVAISQVLDCQKAITKNTGELKYQLLVCRAQYAFTCHKH